MRRELAARLDGITKLSDDDLGRLETDLVAEFDTADALAKSTENVALMQEIATAHDAVVQEQSARSTRGAMGEMVASAAPSRPSAAAFNAQPGGAPRPPEGAQVTGRGALVDRYGKPVEDREGLAEALTASFAEARQGRGQRVPVLSASWASAYPEERRFTGDVVSDTAKLDTQVALVASGGVCSPVAVDWTIPTLAVEDRPLRDGLPSFLASRGGIRFASPVALSSTTGATAIWTEATDANPGTATKPSLSITCPDEVEVFVDAVPTRIRVGNMNGRFFPEAVSNFTETAMAAAARTAELNLLTKISSYSTAVSSGQLLGAARDFVATLELAAAAYRYRQRTRDDHPLTVILPGWAKAMLRADLAREQAHDTQGGDPLAVSDARVSAWFSTRSVSPIWTLDGSSAVTGGVPYAFQGFGNQTADTALLDWPHTLTWWLFASGSFQFLDGGRLDVGVVRDSTMNATNDYELFVETFESVAFRGLEALQIVSAVRPNGESAATASTSTY